MRMKPAPAPAQREWFVSIDGQDVPLHISTDALVGIEDITGKSLFEHAEAARSRAVSIRHLAVIVRCLAGEQCPIPALRGPKHVTIDGLMAARIRLPDFDGGALAAEELIVRNGVIDVLAAVMVPILYALSATPSVEA